MVPATVNKREVKVLRYHCNQMPSCYDLPQEKEMDGSL